MYESQVKEQEYGDSRGQVGCANAVLGQAQAANYPIPPQKTITVAAEIINRLENLHGLLRDVANSQRDLIEKLHGPYSENVCSEKAIQPNGGVLQTIDERLNWLLATAQEIAVNQQRLGRIA